MKCDVIVIILVASTADNNHRRYFICLIPKLFHASLSPNKMALCNRWADCMALYTISRKFVYRRRFRKQQPQLNSSVPGYNTHKKKINAHR